MSSTLSADVLQDQLAISLANVLATANKYAMESGIDVSQSMITITQKFDEEMIWRINYEPKSNFRQRGGDFIVDVKADDASLVQILLGQ